MHVRGKFLAFVFNHSISYAMHNCVYNFHNFHYYFDIDPFSPLQYEKSRTIQKKVDQRHSFACLLTRVTVSSSAFVLNVKRFAICLLDILSSFLPVESEILPSRNYLKTILAIITKPGSPEVSSMSEMISVTISCGDMISKKRPSWHPGFAILDSDFSETSQVHQNESKQANEFNGILTISHKR